MTELELERFIFIGVIIFGLVMIPVAIYRMFRLNRELKKKMKKKEFLDNLHGVRFMSYKELKKYYGVK